MIKRELLTSRWRERLEQAGLDDLNHLLGAEPDAQHLAGRWRTLSKPGLGQRRRWRWELPDDADGTPPATIFVKRYASIPWKEQWDRICRQTLGHSRACWEFEQAERLADAHINVPQAVGFVEHMTGIFEHRSAVLLTAAPGDALDRQWSRLAAENAPITRGLARQEIVVRLARFVAAFHGTGVCHRDLYLCHIFADLDPDLREPPVFWLIDLARAHRPRWRRMRWIIKDLAQLDASARQVGASRSDRLRFLHAYLHLPRGAPRIRWYARRIARKSDWIVRRIARQAARASQAAAK